MADDNQERGTLDHRLASLSEFLKQLYLAGGIPLVVIGLGATNMFLPYGDAPRWVISIVLIAIGTLSWAASVYVTLLRWKVQAQIVAEQDALVLRAVCDIARTEKSDVVPDKIHALSLSLQGLGIRALSLSPDNSSTDGSKDGK